MFIGHFGVGFAAKRVDPRPSLGTLFLASQFVDLLWPIFLLIGWEKVIIDPGNTAFTPLDFVYYPFSHGFLSVLLLSIIFGAVYFIIKKNIKTSIILGALVMSHWILDFITHRPDLPIIPGSDLKVGLGLWNSVILSIIVEGSIFFAGVYLYLKTTQAVNKKGSIGLWSLVIFFVIIYLLNVFGPPPPSTNAIAIAGLFQWVLIIWAYWIDRNRKAEIAS
jgi:hypothetical protein